MRLELECLFNAALDKFNETGCEYSQGKAAAYDVCLKLVQTQEEYIEEEMRKFQMGFAYRKRMLPSVAIDHFAEIGRDKVGEITGLESCCSSTTSVADPSV